MIATLWIISTSFLGTSNNLITKEESFRNFTSIAVDNVFTIEILKSDKYSIIVTADYNIIEFVEVEKIEDKLIIDLNEINEDYNLTSATLQVEITTPKLYSLELSGGANGKIEEFTCTSSFAVDLSGNSILEGKFITTENVEVNVAGGSDIINFEGEANNLIIKATSASIVDLSEFVVNDTDVELNNGSGAIINLNGRLDAELRGASYLFYLGEPILGDIETSSGSTIAQK